MEINKKDWQWSDKDINYFIPEALSGDQRNMQSDWTKGTTGHIKPKNVVSHPISLDNYLHTKI